MSEVNPYAAPASAVVASDRAGGRAIRYAGFVRRAAAAALDGLILGVGAATYSAALLAVELAIPSAEPALSLAGLALLGLLCVAYFVGLESSPIQATLGKAAMGLRVVDLDGRRVSVARALARYAGKAVSALPLMLGFALALVSERRQALHDMMAGTLVVRVV